jgi:hypothetical protein
MRGRAVFGANEHVVFAAHQRGRGARQRVENRRHAGHTFEDCLAERRLRTRHKSSVLGIDLRRWVAAGPARGAKKGVRHHSAVSRLYGTANEKSKRTASVNSKQSNEE